MNLLRILLIFLFSLVTHAQEINREIFYYKDDIKAYEYWRDSENQLVRFISYHKNGKQKELFHFKQGLMDGICYQKNKEGKKMSKWVYENGKLLKRTDYRFTMMSEASHHSLLNDLKEIDETYLEKEKDSLTNHSKNKTIQIYNRQVVYNRLGNDFLAYLENVQLLKLIQTNSTTSERIVANTYDFFGSYYAMYEQATPAIHYKYKALKMSPSQNRLYYNMGCYLADINENALAEKFLNKAIEMAPGHGFANWALAKIYSDKKDYKTAQKFIDIAATKESNMRKFGYRQGGRDIKTTQGFIYHKLGYTEKGLKLLNDALTFDPKNSYALRNMGEIYLDLQQYNKACQYFNKAIKNDYIKVYDKNDIVDLQQTACKQAAKQNYQTENIIESKPNIFPSVVINNTTLTNYEIPNFPYELYNFENKLISKGIANGFVIDLSAVESGLYILRIPNTKESLKFKLIKE